MSRALVAARAEAHARRLGVDDVCLQNAVQALRLGSAGLDRLSAFLDEHPDGLTSGRSAMPPEAIRLVAALRERHVDTAAAPRCAICDRPRKLRHIVEGGRICGSCFNRRNIGCCADCGEDHPIAARLPDGTLRCFRCQALANAETCSGCGRTLRVTGRDSEGRPFCQTCRNRPCEMCTGCDRVSFVHTRTENGPLCSRCYTQPTRTCGGCGRDTAISVRGRDGQPDLCASCADKLCTHPPGPSSDKSLKPAKQVLRPRDGVRISPLPRAPKPIPDCALCGKTRRAHARWPLGPVCSSCYDVTLNAPSLCPDCGLPAVLIGDRDGTRVCGPCAGESRDYRCSSCGAPSRPYSDGRCYRCHLDTLLDALLPSEGRPELTLLRTALAVTDSPRGVLQWLRLSPGAGILNEIVASDVEITHELIDALPQDRAVYFLRGLLTSAGVLEERSERIERFEHWLERRCANVPRPHSNIVRPFAQWTLLRRARRRDAAGKFTEGSAKWLRQRVNAAIDFLEFLEDHQASLETADQALVDLYLAAGSTRRFVVRDFLRWAFKRKLCIQLVVPLRRQLAPTQAFDSDARWDMLRRILHDDTLKSHVRVAGVFVLLYGQHLSRIVTWKTDQIRVDENGFVLIRFMDAEVELVEPLGGLLLGHVDTVRGKAVVGRGRSGQRWIFPGGTPGQHITSELLRHDLAQVGVVLRPSRNSALADLATDIPAGVLAQLLGLHINTAVLWTRSMQQNWQTFVAETYKQSKARPGA